MLPRCLPPALNKASSLHRVFIHSLKRSSTNPPPAAIGTMRARLLYQSKKRGILENDIIIGGFAEENLERMSGEELAKYDEMINGRHMEWDLYYYFTGKKEAPPDLADNPTFTQICDYVLKRKRTI